MIDEVRRERTLEFVLTCKCSGVFLLFINDVERKVRSKNADEICLFGRKMQLDLAIRQKIFHLFSAEIGKKWKVTKL